MSGAKHLLLNFVQALKSNLKEKVLTLGLIMQCLNVKL